MNLPLKLRAIADRDLRSAKRWYDNQAAGLGDRLFEEIRTTMHTIIERPTSFPAVYKDIRRAMTHRFRYGVYFRILGEKIVVIAIQHFHRHPRTWRRRS